MSIRLPKLPVILAFFATMWALVLAPACFAGSPSGPVPQTLTPDVASEQYSEINDAVMKRDLDKIMSFLTPDFSEISSTGKTVNRFQEQKNYKAQFDKIKSMTSTFEVSDVTPAPEGTYCDVTIHMNGIGVKKVMFVNFTAGFTNELVVRDLWVNTASGWKIKSRQTFKDQTVINMS
jgi:hypothetical protein